MYSSFILLLVNMTAEVLSSWFRHISILAIIYFQKSAYRKFASFYNTMFNYSHSCLLNIILSLHWIAQIIFIPLYSVFLFYHFIWWTCLWGLHLLSYQLYKCFSIFKIAGDGFSIEQQWKVKGGLCWLSHSPSTFSTWFYLMPFGLGTKGFPLDEPRE